MMGEDKYRQVDELLGKMTLEQKIGQLFVFSLFGCRIYPDIYDRVLRINCSGLRVCQADRIFRRYTRPKSGELQGQYRIPRGQDRDFLRIQAPYVSPAQFAEHLNQVKRLGMDRPLGIPVHLVLDQEGGNSADFLRGGVHFFPYPMGLTASGDKAVCYRASRAVARQLRAVGINMIHSPVLDVNTNPRNPEIGTRAFSDDAKLCASFALEMFRAFTEEGLVATGKHFPGRGASSEDAHFDLPVLDLSLERLHSIDLLPFKRLIDAGIKAIMIAHTAYPALDPSGDIATISKLIISDLLRGELGFNGVVTTDSISMGALVKQCGDIPEACIRSVEAGSDLILLKDDDWITVKTYETMLDAIKSGRITESRIDESIKRILKMKVDMGLFDNYDIVDPEKLQGVLDDPEIASVEEEAARKAMVLIRDDAKLLPLPRDKKILLVEQASYLGIYANDISCHCGMLWEEMLKYVPDTVMMTEVNFDPTEEDRQRVLDRLAQADLLVMTNDYIRSSGCGTYTDFIHDIIRRGKKVVVVTNTPYDLTARDDFPTVLCTHGSTPASWRQTAKILFGKAKAKGNISVKFNSPFGRGL
jgi:beta-N-acetylhexosaminidase